VVIRYCQIAGGNFGDDLNTLIWPGLFPDMAQLTGRALFYGVGTLLDGRHDKTVKKVVLGSGIGEKHAARSDPNWDFRWVRGPRSAQEFNLSEKLALGDPALLWHELKKRSDGQGAIGLIPHYATWDSYDWTHVASNAGMIAINPRQSPAAVTGQMRTCSRILSESLHGAICADAMGIPWSACVLAHRFNDFKWRDWLATVQRPFTPLVMDRPLVRTIRRSKALVNRLARWTNYRPYTSYPALRAAAAATIDDVWHVSETLYRYGKDESKFSCSKSSDVARQRDRMMTACADFARDYELRFTP
jgi:succinoglycan biosynthesis protein ExoV